MLRLLRYLTLILISRKAIQSVRSLFGHDGLATHVIAQSTHAMHETTKKLKFRIVSILLLSIGILYLVFHTAMEWDLYGYLTFNAQKSVCMIMIAAGAFLLYLASKPIKPLQFHAEVPTQTPTPALHSPTERAEKIHNFFSMMKHEASEFIDEATRPQKTPRNERSHV